MSIAELPVQQVPIRLRMRPDLSATRQYWQGVEYWVVKEPLGQKYFQLPPQVFFLLQQLDGQRSALEVLENYHSEFAPRRLSLDQLHSLLQRFHRDALILSDASGQGTELLKRGKKNKRLERLATWSNVLAIRFRGVDPDRLLTRLNGWTWWLFTKPAAFFVAIKTPSYPGGEPVGASGRAWPASPGSEECSCSSGRAKRSGSSGRPTS